MIHRGCCQGGCIESLNDNHDKISNYFNPCAKLDDYDWLRELPQNYKDFDAVEIRFKNTRKAFFRNNNQLRLKRGDLVAVEASPGHDIGIICLTGEIVALQMMKYGVDPKSEDLKKVYRKAKQVDIDKWKEAIEQETITMLKSRKIAENLKLEMKIGDVEYQGDKTKAIFYYIADVRVDFRELIKILADEFKIRIEMRQIGARQEAGRIGGIGSCGRELCCATWITSFVSVTTAAARYQEVSLNPQKLAGQCGKLKCCLNYEVTSYLDAQKDFPDKEIVLKTVQGEVFHQKTDIYRGIYWYSFDKYSTLNLIPMSVERVNEIIEANKSGETPEAFDLAVEEVKTEVSYQNDFGQDSLTRFDEQKSKSFKKKKKKKKGNPPTEV
jgi:cell fate regulator YaaT (PSP1 superfamily)